MDFSAWLPSSLDPVDLLLVVVILLGIGSGWRQGFVSGALSLATLAAGLLTALAFHAPLATWLTARALVTDPWAAPAAFVIVLGAVSLAVGSMARAVMRWLPYRAHVHRLNRWFGLLPGAIIGGIYAAVLAAVLAALPLPGRFIDEVRKSNLAERLSAPAEVLEAHLRPIFEPAVKRTMPGLTVAPDSHESVRLPFSVADARARPDLEAAMLVLVNDERSKAGLQALQSDPQALDTARAHSQDMFARGYFSHTGPGGASPFDRMRANGLRFRSAGENLALAPTLPMAHKGLMESPGHRANILQPSFRRVAIGILDGDRRGLMVTQTFRD